MRLRHVCRQCLKWFPGRRGLAAGCTAAGFGAGAALTVVPIANMVESSGYQHTFLFFGVLQGAILCLMALGMIKAPDRHDRATASQRVSTRADSTPAQVLRTPVFWVMYAMFVLVAAGGLMLASSLAPIAKDLGIDRQPVQLLGFALPALSFALSLDRMLDGAGRPFFGWVSDRIGRENTMCIAFGIGAVALYMLSRFGSDPVGFVIFTGVYFGCSAKSTVCSRPPRRHLRIAIRRIQCRHALHRQGHRVPAGATGGLRVRNPGLGGRFLGCDGI